VNDSASETKRCLGFKKGFHAVQTILVMARHNAVSLCSKQSREAETGAQRAAAVLNIAQGPVLVGFVCLSIIGSRVAPQMSRRAITHGKRVCDREMFRSLRLSALGFFCLRTCSAPRTTASMTYQPRQGCEKQRAGTFGPRV
jgi:hypothetical protein